MASPAPRRLGKYRLLKQLAVGGMAEIYVASAEGLAGFEKKLALKVIHPNYSSDPDFVQMLVDEAKLAVQLQHANIVQTYDLGRVEDTYYIVMELIDGSDLHKILKRTVEKDDYLPFEMAAYVASEVAAGLDYAHRKSGPDGAPLQLVHRDISPQNILVSNAGEVKIVDFGIAKAARQGRQTAVGVIKGKYYYMAPEQAWGDPIDARTDIFAAGILLYEMLAGEMLYFEEDMERLLDQVRKADLQPPSTRRSAVPRDLEAIAMRALQRKPRDRFPSAGEMSLALQKWLRANAPEFTPMRVGQLVQKLMGGGPAPAATATAKQRSPKESTAEVQPLDPSLLESIRDENSLIFRLSDLKKTAGKSQRQADESTGLVPAPPSDFAETDETMVDDPGGRGPSMQAALAALAAIDPRRPVVDPALDPAAPGGDEDEPTGRMSAAQAARATGFDDGSDTSRSHQAAAPRKGPTAVAAKRDALPGVRAAPPSVRRPTAPPGPARPTSAAPAPHRPPSTGAVPRSIAPERAEPMVRPPSSAPAGPVPQSPQTVRPTVQGRALSHPPAGATPQADRAVTSELSSQRGGDEPPTTEWNFGVGPSPLAAPGALPPNAMAQLPTPPPPSTLEPTAPGNAPSEAARGWPWNPGSPPPDPSASSFASGPQAALPSAAFQLDRIQPSPRRWPLVLLGIALIGGLAIALIALATSRPSIPALASIEVVTLPAGAAVSLDGRALPGRSPARIDDVDPIAQHKVSVSLAGYEPWEREVAFDGGSRQMSLHVVLSPSTAALQVDSQPQGADVTVNGRMRGQTPLEVSDLSSAQDLTVELRLRGYHPEKRTLTWSGKRRLELSVPLTHGN